MIRGRGIPLDTFTYRLKSIAFLEGTLLITATFDADQANYLKYEITLSETHTFSYNRMIREAK